MEAFVAYAWEQGKRWARNDLPWRFLDDPYAVYVSEAMLQQTQVVRVLDHWPRFMAAFPTVDALASASTSDVLDAWQGLGYNRRALALKRAADTCAREHHGAMPRTIEQLEALPGVGPATAAGIMAFAYQRPSVYIETNVRAVFIQWFFADAEGTVNDRQLRPLVEAACSVEHPREWYYALLDWGAHLKSTGVNPSRKSAHYSRQSAFEGSRRQKRAFVLREVLGADGITRGQVKDALDASENQVGRAASDWVLFDSIVDDLINEGFFYEQDGLLRA